MTCPAEVCKLSDLSTTFTSTLLPCLLLMSFWSHVVPSTARLFSCLTYSLSTQMHITWVGKSNVWRPPLGQAWLWCSALNLCPLFSKKKKITDEMRHLCLVKEEVQNKVIRCLAYFSRHSLYMYAKKLGDMEELCPDVWSVWIIDIKRPLYFFPNLLMICIIYICRAEPHSTLFVLERKWQTAGLCGPSFCLLPLAL